MLSITASPRIIARQEIIESPFPRGLAAAGDPRAGQAIGQGSAEGAMRLGLDSLERALRQARKEILGDTAHKNTVL